MFELSSFVHIMSFNWFVGLVFLLGWIEDEAPMNSFPPTLEPKSDDIFCCQIGYCKMTEL
jgi:hypothetical protein